VLAATTTLAANAGSHLPLLPKMRRSTASPGRKKASTRALRATSPANNIMGILLIYLYNGAAGHARARQGQLLPYLAARSVQKCVSVCGLIRNDVPASCVCLQLATAV
jgi:hypothetical protein